MSDDIIEGRRRKQTLLIVEGSHEKNKLFYLLFRCFPEINVEMENVWIYGTNIYRLYEDIVKEYGEEWMKDDIDLPFILSRKQRRKKIQYKEDFVNIILVFDYERHDPNFSESRILAMQGYFADAADTGKLYINYPMIESYQHVKALPDDDYRERKVAVTLDSGKEYKALVRKETMLAEWIEFPQKIEELLRIRFHLENKQVWEKCYDELLTISSESDIEEKIHFILHRAVDEKIIKTAEYQFRHLILNLGYIHQKQSYWKYMRGIFRQLILQNIDKANIIQGMPKEREKDDDRKKFLLIDLLSVLKIQNRCSRDTQDGIIWVLNTCIFFVADYNFKLVISNE